MPSSAKQNLLSRKKILVEKYKSYFQKNKISWPLTRNKTLCQKDDMTSFHETTNNRRNNQILFISITFIRKFRFWFFKKEIKHILSLNFMSLPFESRGSNLKNTLRIIPRFFAIYIHPHFIFQFFSIKLYIARVSICPNCISYTLIISTACKNTHIYKNKPY